MDDTEDATYKDLIERDNLQTIHDDNINTLLVEIYKSTHYISPPIMWIFFDLKIKKVKASWLLFFGAT